MGRLPSLDPVGGHTITEVRGGLSRESICGLGGVFGKGPVIAVIIDRRSRLHGVRSSGCTSGQIASLPLDGPLRLFRLLSVSMTPKTDRVGECHHFSQ
jgi:hypothetical protein